MKEAQVLAHDEGLSGRTVDLLNNATQAVRKVFQPSSLVLKMVAKDCLVDNLSSSDWRWPMVLTLQTDDGLCGSHAITAWNGWIYDSNFPHPLLWCQRSLDWCSGQGSRCVGFFRVYRLGPEYFDNVNTEGNVRIGMQVETGSGSSSVLGWVGRLPSQRKVRYTVRFTDGNTVQMSLSDVLQ